MFFCLAMLPMAGMAYAKKVRVLFVGNSYTYVNNLPQIVKDVAASAGDTLVYDMSASGGAAFYQQVDPSVIATVPKIQAGGWDYVVLQEQSQSPAYPPELFDEWVYPYAKQLVDLVRQYNPCAEVIFYMTWGRKNGDTPSMCTGFPNWPYYCTYHTMDSVIRARYMLLADSNKTSVSPVGPVWKYIRTNYPGIELYDADESHPSPAGSYAGACSFYTAIFKKPADSITYNYSLPATDAANIRTAATKVVYDSTGFWSIGQYETIAGFTYNANGMQPVSFVNTSTNANQYNWDFGDGQISTATNPTHTYALPGSYTVRLVSTGISQCSDTSYVTITIGALGIATPDATGTFTISPNPAAGTLYVKSTSFTKENYRIKILNGMEQLVYEQQSTRTEMQSIDVSGITSGVYMLSISNKTGTICNQRIIVRY